MMDLARLYVWLYWSWVVSEVAVLIVTRTSRSGGDVRDRGSLLILWPVIFFSIFFAMSVGGAHWYAMFGEAHWLRAASLIVLVIGLAIRWTAIVSLGRSFSANVAIHAAQTVRKTGLFRWVRHPSYTGMMLIFLAIGLHTRNWISLAIMLIPTGAALLYRIHVEEQALRGAFGQEYVEYSRVTKRLLPGIY